MAEILHFEILRKHGQTNTHTNKHTNRHGHYNTSPSPYGGRGNNICILECIAVKVILECIAVKVNDICIKVYSHMDISCYLDGN